MSKWRERVEKLLMQPDPQYVIQAAAWAVALVVVVVFFLVRLLSR